MLVDDDDVVCGIMAYKIKNKKKYFNLLLLQHSERESISIILLERIIIGGGDDDEDRHISAATLRSGPRSNCASFFSF